MLSPAKKLAVLPSLLPTPEQEHILSLLHTTKDNLLINAFAGSGKTSTLELIQNAAAPPVLCLAFNKRIANEMEKRFRSTTTVRTLNSLGHRIWAQTCSGNLTLDPKKCQELLREQIKSLPKGVQGEAYEIFWDTITAIGLAKSLGYVPERYFPNAKRLASKADFFTSLDEKPSELLIDLCEAVLVSSIKAAYAGFIDYNDQIYMPALFGGTYPRFPLVLVDEAQDLSPTNHEMLGHLSRSRIIAVGDPFQCHPPGTLIQVTGSGKLPIESLKEGMQVAHYDTKDALFKGVSTQGREIEQITQSDFEGDLVVVTAGNNVLKMTPNHKVIARIGRDTGGCLVYLMRRNGQYRIGTSNTHHYQNSFGPSHRARQERADAMWILSYHDSPEAAYIQEQVLSIKYGIPAILFESETQQDRIDAIWEEIGDNSTGAVALLEKFHRDVTLPIWRDGSWSFIGFHRACVIHACNLVPNLMVMLSFPAAQWNHIQVEYEPYSGPVYGLTVEPAQNGKRLYLANNLLVHNSIYGFRGAVQGGMAQLRERFEMTEADLSVSFRCPRKIVELARWRVPQMKWNREGGRIGQLRNPVASSFVDGSAIICRNNAPLFALSLRLLGAGRSVSVGGSDIGPRVVGIMRKLGDDSTTKEELLHAIENWRAEKLAKESTSADDIADCMRVFAEHGTTLGQAVAYADHLFEHKSGTITLLTGHKAKGLEWQTVYHLDPWLIKDFGEQELNLRYVIQTRAMEAYYEVDSREIRWQTA